MTTFSERYGYDSKRPLDPILEDAPDWLILGFELNILDRFRARHTFHNLALTIAYKFRLGGYSTDDYEHAWEYLSYFIKAKWYHFYDFVELLGEQIRETDRENAQTGSFSDPKAEKLFPRYQHNVNEFFIFNNVGWRLDNDGLLKRELPVELKENLEQVEQEVICFQPVKEHIDKAKRFVTQRPLDPENSIKEIASALESLARIYYPDGKTLGAAIDLMKKEKAIPPTLAIMIDKFYGFACEAPNVRHGAPVPSTVTLLDAEFCLFAGAAMLRYLNKILSEKSNLYL